MSKHRKDMEPIKEERFHVKEEKFKVKEERFAIKEERMKTEAGLSKGPTKCSNCGAIGHSANICQNKAASNDGWKSGGRDSAERDDRSKSGSYAGSRSFGGGRGDYKGGRSRTPRDSEDNFDNRSDWRKGNKYGNSSPSSWGANKRATWSKPSGDSSSIK